MCEPTLFGVSPLQQSSSLISRAIEEVRHGHRLWDLGSSSTWIVIAVRPAVLVLCPRRSGVDVFEDRRLAAGDKLEYPATSVKLHTCVHDENRQSLPDFTQPVFPVAHVWGTEEQLAHFQCGGVYVMLCIT